MLINVLRQESNLTFQSLTPLASGLPKLVVLSDIMLSAVERLCEGLIAAGIDLKILCLSKSLRFCAPDVRDIWPHLIEVRDDKGRYLHNKYMTMLKIKLNKYPDKAAGFDGAYIDINLGINLAEQPDFMDAGVALLSMVHGLVDWESNHHNFLGKAIAWRLPAYSPYTGYCTCPGGCEKWKSSGCKACPQLGSSVDGSDLVADTFIQKKRAFTDMDITAVTLSNWQGKCVRESLLFKKFPQTTIPMSVNLDVYAPMPRDEVRSACQLPKDRKVILFAAGYINRRNKGFHLLCEALTLLQGQWNAPPPILCFFGKEPPLDILPAGYEYKYLGYLDDINKIAMAYAAADVFVSPAFEDNLPRTVNEALSCGTPVVCFNKYSSEDVVLDGITGYVAEHPGLFPYLPDGTQMHYPPYSVPSDRLFDLADKIKKVLELPEDDYLAMRARCREYAQSLFSPVLETARYLRLFRRMCNLPDVKIDGLQE